MRRTAAYLGRGKWLPAGGETAVMGILNVTPDSFSDGGELSTLDKVLHAASLMHADGARILDLGGESTRPGAGPVPVDEELRRVIPVVRALSDSDWLPISIDTRKARVFHEAYLAGASILNDVSGLRADPEMAKVAAKADVAVILMHSRGTPETMNSLTDYGDVVEDVIAELRARVEFAIASGIPRERLILDPGLGFAKTPQQSIEVLRRIDEFRTLGLPLLVGPSRKRFLWELTAKGNPGERDAGTAGVVAHLVARGIEIVRVHAVGLAVDVKMVTEALTSVPPDEGSG